MFRCSINRNRRYIIKRLGCLSHRLITWTSNWKDCINLCVWLNEKETNSKTSFERTRMNWFARTVASNTQRETTWIGLVRPTPQFGEGQCGGAVGRNKEKLQGANSQNIMTKTKMRMLVKQTQRTENSCAFVALSTDIFSKTASWIRTWNLMTTFKSSLRGFKRLLI